jgi:hypothetical protein
MGRDVRGDPNDSPTTGSAGNKCSGDPPTSTTSPRYHPTLLRKNAGHHRIVFPSPTPARLDATRTRPNAQRPPPPPRNPAARMVPARLLHPHRPGHLPAQHANAATITDNRARPLTPRHWHAIGFAEPRPGIHSPGTWRLRGRTGGRDGDGQRVVRGVGGGGSRGPWPVEPRDRRAAIHLPEDSRASSGPHPGQARRAGRAEAAGLAVRMSS